MKLTKNRLKQIIKEEFSAAMGEDRDPEEDPAQTAKERTVKLVKQLDELVEKIKDSLQEEHGPGPWKAIAHGTAQEFPTATSGAESFDPETGEQVFETTS